MTDSLSKVLTIAVLGGTGKEGAGLVLRWAQAGYRVIIGSRNEEKALSRAAELNEILGSDVVRGMANRDAAQAADIVVLSVPYAAHEATLTSVQDALHGKILVDVTVPLQPPHVRTVNLPAGQAASLEAQTLLGDEVRVVAAFQNISAPHLTRLDHPVDSDVLMCGDDPEAKQEVAQLITAIDGMRAVDAGPLVNAIAVESLTPVILYINKTYKVRGAGIRITGLE